jgi:hypothetical protein
MHGQHVNASEQLGKLQQHVGAGRIIESDSVITNPLPDHNHLPLAGRAAGSGFLPVIRN